MANEKLLLGVGGFGRYGKDTFAALIEGMVREGVSVRRYKFADCVREECRGKCEELGIDPWTEDPVDKETIRPWLVEVGVGRRDEDPNYWIKKLAESLAKDSGPGIQVITDLRYINEVKWVLDNGGICTLLHRRGCEPLNAEEALQTAKLYTTKDNPFAYRPNFRPYWWTHEILQKTHLKEETKCKREAGNILQSIPELKPFMPESTNKLKLDRNYLDYIKAKGLKLPDVFTK